MSATHGPTWALRAHAASEWVLWVVTINALWWVFTLAGLGLFGAAPATFAAAELTRRQLRGERTRPVREFASAWRREFLRANALLGPFLVAAALLIGNVLALGPGPLRVAAIAAGALVTIVVHALVPLYACYDLRLGSYVPTAMRWAARNLAHVLVLLAVSALIVGASAAVPGLIPFVSMGAIVVANAALGSAFFAANERALAERTSPTSSLPHHP
ncbi:YesL family protein [Microbacterium excoecariae]|uniref:YesL family protein n=1 Tax=Microbacterium excoecariae TaxID=2715210 RepID=UPI00140C2E06|nr:DUF624 domain-containing protein [Microbacterium excoecariae]NHI17340.1 DUF624 domain-containing protein [Microbacterium excoecariae]